MLPKFVIATAGHVDHGKSALVQALTGTDPDRLPEEKARGITIQLGFAHLTIPANERRPEMHVGVVDVPGHEDFVKNMVGGVGSIDLALMVVAADDGWMPQTEEHLQILSYLGVARAVIALTKCDLADSREEAALLAVREKLGDSPFAGAPIVSTSVVTGRGLEKLKETLAETLAATSPQPDLGKPRLPIDRVFTLRGIGVVVTGTLSGGTLRRGQTVTLQPSGRVARIRSLQNHNQEVEVATPGTRMGLNLPDLSAQTDSDSHGSGVQRGHIVTLGELGSAHDTADVVLERSSRLIESGACQVKDGKRVRIHHGSGNFPARLLMTTAELRPGDQALGELQFEAPVFLFAGDRFIMRDWSEQRTLAGGIILDPDASRRNFRTAPQQAFLAQRAAHVQPAAFVRSQLARDGAVRRNSLLVKSRFSLAEVSQAIAQLEQEGAAVFADDIVADAEWWKRLTRSALEAIEAWHRNHPEQIGMPLNELRPLLECDAAPPGVFDSIMAELGRSGFEQVGATIRRKTHRPALPPHLKIAGDKLCVALAAKPLEPPSRKELIADPAAHQALRFLIQSGQAVEVGPELVLLAESFARARDAVRSFLRTRNSATVSELREALATSRRVIVPLLEHFDRTGVTLRQGDKRILREPK